MLYYAIVAFDQSGNQKFYSDSHKLLKNALKCAKDYKIENPHHTVLIRKQLPSPGIGLYWKDLREV